MNATSIAKIPEKRIDEILAHVMFQKNSQDIRTLLFRNGVQGAYEMKDSDARYAFLKAIAESTTFRKEVSDYLTGMVMAQTEERKGFIMQPSYLNLFDASDPTDVGDVPTSTTPTTTTTATKTTFWQSLGGVATGDNLSKLFNVGLDTLSTKLQSDINKDSEERALQAKMLDLQIAQQQAAAAAGGGTSKGLSAGAWIGIIAGVGLLGFGVWYFAIRKKK